MTPPETSRDQSGTHPEFLKIAGQNLGLAPPRGTEAPRPGMFASLSHVEFRRYWIGLFISNVGGWMQTVAQGWLVLRLSDSAFLLGVIAFAGGIPSLLLAPLAGLVADRADRRRILITTHLAMTAGAVTLAVATGFGFVSVPLVAAVALSNGIASAMTTPSHQSIFLDLVGRRDLMNAIALNSMQFNLSRIVGPALAGFTIASFGETTCFVLNALSYSAILVAIFLLPKLHTSHARSRGAWLELRAGLRFARRDPLLPSLLTICAALAIFGTPAVTLAPVFARYHLGVGPEGLGGMLSAVGMGAVATALPLASRGDLPRKGFWVTVAAAAFAVSLAVLAASPVYAISLAALALLGSAMMSSSSLINTLMQKRAPDRMRGRIISLFVLAWIGLVPVGNLLAGAVAEQFGPAAALWTGSAGIALTLGLVQFLRPIPRTAA
jgi:MFS family permease